MTSSSVFMSPSINKFVSRSFPDGPPLGNQLLPPPLSLCPRRNVCNGGSHKKLPLPPPSRQEPTAQDAPHSLIRRNRPSKGPRTDGDDVRTRPSDAIDLNPRRGPGTGGRSAPEYARAVAAGPLLRLNGDFFLTEEPTPEIQRHVDQPDQHRHLDQRADDRGKATPEPIPKTATATAIASSKLLLAAVNDSVAVLE